jgi:hypothetical protein
MILDMFHCGFALSEVLDFIGDHGSQMGHSEGLGSRQKR